MNKLLRLFVFITRLFNSKTLLILFMCLFLTYGCATLPPSKQNATSKINKIYQNMSFNDALEMLKDLSSSTDPDIHWGYTDERWGARDQGDSLGSSTIDYTISNIKITSESYRDTRTQSAGYKTRMYLNTVNYGDKHKYNDPKGVYRGPGKYIINEKENYGGENIFREINFTEIFELTIILHRNHVEINVFGRSHVDNRGKPLLESTYGKPDDYKKGIISLSLTYYIREDKISKALDIAYENIAFWLRLCPNIDRIWLNGPSYDDYRDDVLYTARRTYSDEILLCKGHAAWGGGKNRWGLKEPCLISGEEMPNNDK